MDTKAFWKSKTFWVNALTLLISALTMIAGNEQIDPRIVALVTGIAIPVVNVVLRFLTDEPMTLSGKPRKPFYGIHKNKR